MLLSHSLPNHPFPPHQPNRFKPQAITDEDMCMYSVRCRGPSSTSVFPTRKCDVGSRSNPCSSALPGVGNCGSTGGRQAWRGPHGSQGSSSNSSGFRSESPFSSCTDRKYLWERLVFGNQKWLSYSTWVTSDAISLWHKRVFLRGPGGLVLLTNCIVRIYAIWVTPTRLVRSRKM